MVQATSVEFKGYRTVQVPSSSSLIPNNLSASPDGNSFVTIKNNEKGCEINIFDSQIVEQNQDSVSPTLTLTHSTSDCMFAQFHCVGGLVLLVCGHIGVCNIYNQHGTRLLFNLELGKKDNAPTWFTCASVAYCGDAEFLAIGTNDGRIFRVDVQNQGASFTHDIAFTMGLCNAIMSMASDPKS